MIPATFDYLRASSVDEAVSVLADRAAGGDEAKVLAGGQSLLPLLRLRLASPSVLVDVGSVPDLRGVRVDGDSLLIGAMTTHHQVVRDPAVRAHCPILAQATATVADPAVRHRGTLGGSLAHADPAGDLPAVALALDADLQVAGPAGRRSVPAGEFFQDYLQTALGADDLLVGVRVPALGAGWGTHYEKFQRVAQAWAVVGVAALVRVEDGTIAEARIGLTNMGATPVRATAVEQALVGVPTTDGDRIVAACRLAGQDSDPPADLSAQPDYRRHLAGVLTGRAVHQAISGS